jgi:hypothetical protein
VPQLRRAFSRRPTFLAFYVGRDDARFRAENVQLDAELDAAKVPHLFKLYPGRTSRRSGALTLDPGSSSPWTISRTLAERGPALRACG